jgi:hypothetical protein
MVALGIALGIGLREAGQPDAHAGARPKDWC